MPYLTPDNAAGPVVCWTLTIPNSPDWTAIVTGALLVLTRPSSFEAYGTASPTTVAAFFRDMLDNAIFHLGVCRVIGEIVCYAGTTSPDSNWLPCDGASLLRASYPDLFAVIGTTYGAVDSTHFNLPELRGRVVVDSGTGPGLTARNIGDNGGEEIHTLITAEIPSHTHTDTGHTHAEGTAAVAVAQTPVIPVPSAVPAIGITASGSANLTNTGGDGSHENMQPWLCLNYFIVAL